MSSSPAVWCFFAFSYFCFHFRQFSFLSFLAIIGPSVIYVLFFPLIYLPLLFDVHFGGYVSVSQTSPPLLVFFSLIPVYRSSFLFFLYRHTLFSGMWLMVFNPFALAFAIIYLSMSVVSVLPSCVFTLIIHLLLVITVWGHFLLCSVFLTNGFFFYSVVRLRRCFIQILLSPLFIFIHAWWNLVNAFCSSFLIVILLYSVFTSVVLSFFFFQCTVYVFVVHLFSSYLYSLFHAICALPSL